MFKNTLLIAGTAATILLSGCSATESSKTIEASKVQSFNSAYTGVKSKLSVGQFQNQSSFHNGIFSSGADRLGSQAKTILLTHLQQSNRFTVLDRANLAALKQEVGFSAAEQNIKGAQFVVTGDVSEFGRKEQGDKQLFGILGKGKSQVAYAKVNLNIVDVLSSEVVYSVQGAGEYSLSSREVIGFGSAASYDSTLNGKVLDLAIREAVNNLVSGIEKGDWQPN
ncbi:Putative lipoprotein/NMB1164 [Pseudoalteromonas holothuriae]|uniref:Curli production assembly/transport component CsgG n=1 Tax=Pseudoalteromonas holothuriae TaxID=2963714 RepID=A0A9W4QVZ5_9GAMM|nr:MULTISPECIES: CsgG/HfaB family protein [unclassified Pseudoalteromonas]CAH9055531.1 Putative lipoprotein/NMB1164 [Pseudoalteromonas sp. CIP111854]CAH9063025.1 Putative lipoprotein/NMB1164 [Pseudoalteromonas sp. CIP111951]